MTESKGAKGNGFKWNGVREQNNLVELQCKSYRS
jgi:hypothetical protein